jgi:hypothetical protein
VREGIYIYLQCIQLLFQCLEELWPVQKMTARDNSTFKYINMMMMIIIIIMFQSNFIQFLITVVISVVWNTLGYVRIFCIILQYVTCTNVNILHTAELTRWPRYRDERWFPECTDNPPSPHRMFASCQHETMHVTFLALHLPSDRPETNEARSFQLVQFYDLCCNGGHMLCMDE